MPAPTAPSIVTPADSKVPPSDSTIVAVNTNDLVSDLAPTAAIVEMSQVFDSEN